MVDRINPMSQLLEALRVSRSERTGKIEKTEARKDSERERGRRDGFDNKRWATLRQEISQSLINVDLSQKQQLVQASTNTIRSVLRFQWGQSVVQEPQFVAMIEKMEHKIDANPELQQKFSEILEELKSGKV